jgi:hypothetical protein
MTAGRAAVEAPAGFGGAGFAGAGFFAEVALNSG